LHVHRQRGEHSEETLSGEHFFAGDRLRFQIDLSEDGEVTILGVEPNGHLYTAWPLDPSAADTNRKAGAGQVLEGAVTLDDTVGTEILYLVRCPPAFGPPACSVQEGHALACDARCALSPFTLDKRP
jgi:hypothetical protein